MNATDEETPRPWAAPPGHLALEPGWVHIFRLRLALPAERLARLGQHLPEDERARAERYLVECARVQFQAAHGQMRLILGQYLGVEPAALRFELNPYGKPYLPGAPLRFNLSHSREMGLLAVTGGQEVGCDIEDTQRSVEFPRLAKRFFAPQEAAELASLPAEQQPAAFFACWTRKEAYIKARGLGLAIPLDSFTVSLAPGELPRLSDPGWSVYTLAPGEGYAASLVVEDTAQGLRCWDWPVA